MTNAQAFDAAMTVEDPERANAIFEALVKRTVRDTKLTRPKAEQQVRDNLGYYAGYYDDGTRERVEHLFKCEHPIFGPIKNGKPTQKEAFELGLKWGRKAFNE